MTFVEKQAIVNSIIEKLDLGDEPTTVLSENLNKMTKAALIGLATAITAKIDTGIGRLKTAAKLIPDGPPVPLEIMPNDVGMAKTANDVTEQLSMLPTIGERLAITWESGNFPLLKRNLRISERITDNCRKMVAQQLYDAIRIEEDVDETHPVDD